MNRIPPQNTEYETGLIVACMLGQSAEVVELVKPDAFYANSSRAIYETICGMVYDGDDVDLVTVTNRLRAKGLLEKVGGASYLADIVSNFPVAVNINHYADEINQKAALRQVITKCTDGINSAYDPACDPNRTIGKIQSDILSIEVGCNRSNVSDIKETCMAVVEEINERSRRPNDVTGIPTGFGMIDKNLRGYQDSDFIILAARPSMGKTALMLNQIKNMALKDIPVGVFSLEMSRKQLVYRLIAQQSKVDTGNLYCGRVNQSDYESINKASDRLYSAPIFIDDTAALNLNDFKTRSRRMKKAHDIKIIFIDYLQLMTTDKQPTRDREVAAISAGIKATAKELDIPIVALNQLNRALEQRPDKRPRLSDLRDSGTLEQDADVVTFLFRPEPYIEKKYTEHNQETEEYAKLKNYAEINIAKHRNGKTGMVQLFWKPEITSFENIAMEA